LYLLTDEHDPRNEGERYVGVSWFSKEYNSKSFIMVGSKKNLFYIN